MKNLLTPCSIALIAFTTACGGESTRSPRESTMPGVAASGSQATGGDSGGSPLQDFGGAAGGRPGSGTAGSAIASGGAIPSDALASSGCGKPLPPEQVPTVPSSRTGYTEFQVAQTGATLGASVPTDAVQRHFFVRVPSDYDKSRPYRVVYIGQGCSDRDPIRAKTNTYPLFDERLGGSEQAVYVALSVPDNDVNPGCYDNNNGAESMEWEAFDMIHSFVESTYCVDNSRIFVGGYSSGAWLANMWGCYFAGTPSPPLDQPDVDAGRNERKFAPHWAIRGHLAASGSLPPNQPVPCNGPAAGFWIHDPIDKSSLIDTNIAALNLSLKSNGCTGDYENGPKQPWAPAEQIPGLQGGVCQLYTGCPDDVAKKYPLVFCTPSGVSHSDNGGQAVPAFTQFMNQLDVAP